ncbi:hypothetical protein HMPREF0043_00473 [Actinobaculum sp. oral taxon 183 str. F0552]|nr:hypothetical protein HMPREF0043_00473 [Actinobaculum sp. oral taxon 183 str. F0552]
MYINIYSFIIRHIHQHNDIRKHVTIIHYRYSSYLTRENKKNSSHCIPKLGSK